MLDSIHTALATMPPGIFIKWLVIFMPLLSLAIWHFYQDRGYEHFSAQPSPRIFRELQNVARHRSFQVIGVWMILLLVIVGGDIWNQKAITTIPDEPLMAVPVVPAPESPETKTILQTTPELVAVSPDPAASGASPAVSDLSKEEKLDRLKQRYEDMLVSYYFLQRCQHAFPQELEVINKALYSELRILGGDETLHQGIFSAARGSYESVYSDTPCEAKYVDKTLKEYNKMINQLKQAQAQ